ncbi:hypothetical protein CYMTET_55378 [Cymbomonas tetramitiformis]|uniref:Uncharacterized protein n=1 Tax=Cymbomonas tetramitiformis TaxID=36881 RepID=A0AAE0EPT7_9CHLO|nr:hypothetical protein CYMTET_55378 [Cymbomonas tetramitiformis]
MSLAPARRLCLGQPQTSADFHADSSVWEPTPVRASQRAEYADKLDYAFTYGEELSKLTRSHGFKPNVGLTLDVPDSEADFAVLLGNMSHVFGSISRDEFLKLLDLDFEYEVYHLTLNEVIYVVLPTVLRAPPLPRVEGLGDPATQRLWVRLRHIIINEDEDPSPQRTVFRTLAGKHRKLYPEYSDRDMVEDLHVVLRASAAVSPHVTPLYLVVLRDLNAGRHFTYAALALYIATVYRDEKPLARLSSPPPSESIWWWCRWWSREAPCIFGHGLPPRVDQAGGGMEAAAERPLSDMGGR